MAPQMGEHELLNISCVRDHPIYVHLPRKQIRCIKDKHHRQFKIMCDMVYPCNRRSPDAMKNLHCHQVLPRQRNGQKPAVAGQFLPQQKNCPNFKIDNFLPRQRFLSWHLFFVLRVRCSRRVPSSHDCLHHDLHMNFYS